MKKDCVFVFFLPFLCIAKGGLQLEENPVKSGFLQIYGTHIFNKSSFQIIPPPNFSGSNGFFHMIFSIKNSPLSGFRNCEILI